MNTTKPTKNVKVCFCRCGTQFQVETRGQRSCPGCIEAKAIAEANKPPVVCRHCGEAKEDCYHRVCADCKAAKVAAEEARRAARKPRTCKTCGDKSLTLSMGICGPCRDAAWMLRHEKEEQEEKREPETDPIILKAYEAMSMLLAVITNRREELREEAAAALAALPPEQQPHADQAAIDAAVALILAGVDL